MAEKHIIDLARANKMRQALDNKNIKLKAQVAEVVSHQCRLSIEVSPPVVSLDNVIERASCGLLAERMATLADTTFTTRLRALNFGAPLFASASTSVTNASNEGDVDQATFLAMQSRVEGAEKE